MISICTFCNSEEPVIQLCCPTGQKCCNDCFLVGNISNDKVCSCCQRPLGKKAKKLIRELMEYNSLKYVSQRQGVQGNRENMSMTNTNMYMTQRKQNYGGRNNQQVAFNKTTFQGNYQNHQYPPHPGFMNQGFPAPYQMMGYPPPNFHNWQPPAYCYGQIPNMQPMMAGQQHRNGAWVNPYELQQNYNYQNYCRNPQYESQSDQQFIERTKRSADKGLPHYVHDNLLENSKEQRANFRGYQQQLNKTTDLIEQTTNNKVVRMNRSSSVNNLTVRR